MIQDLLVAIEGRIFIMCLAGSMAAMVSSVVGPTYARLILDSFGWKGVFASLFMVGILIIICGILFMKNITDRETQ